MVLRCLFFCQQLFKMLAAPWLLLNLSSLLLLWHPIVIVQLSFIPIDWRCQSKRYNSYWLRAVAFVVFVCIAARAVPYFTLTLWQKCSLHVIVVVQWCVSRVQRGGRELLVFSSLVIGALLPLLWVLRSWVALSSSLFSLFGVGCYCRLWMIFDEDDDAVTVLWQDDEKEFQKKQNFDIILASYCKTWNEFPKHRWCFFFSLGLFVLCHECVGFQVINIDCFAMSGSLPTHQGLIWHIGVSVSIMTYVIENDCPTHLGPF